MKKKRIMKNRVHNFNPGPAALPLPVLEEIQEHFLSFSGSGMSIIETSHRSLLFDEVLDDAIERTQRLLSLDENYHVLFIQGGASLQFCMIPMNLAVPGKPLNFINTGTWSTKAIQEAQIQGKDVRVIASSEDKDFSYLPHEYTVDKQASYLHFTSNNTIKGTQWHQFPNGNDIPLVADMSSDFMSRPIDMKPFGLVYAGAQKNIGPSGIALVIIREDMLERVPNTLPTMLKYTTYKDNRSLFNTPPTFPIYVIDLVLTWLEETVGGLKEIEQTNKQKASLIYDAIDRSDIYRGTTEVTSRSLMNITFRLPDEKIEERFLAEATQRGLHGLKGHKSVGGCRASLYNAISIDSVRELVTFMREFERKSI